MVEQFKEYNSYDLIETINGEAIIEDYKAYKYTHDMINEIIYVYAEKAEGGFDVYKIVLK